MGKRNAIKMRRLLYAAIAALALCAGFGFAVQGGMEAVEAKQAVRLTKSQARLVKGETLRLQLRGAKGKAVWKSKDKTVASVDQKGIVRAKKSGKTKISVKYGKKAYLCTIWVEAPKINKKSVTLNASAKAQLKISGTKQKVSWSSSQKAIAAVNAKGLVTAKKAGKATITAKVGTKKFQCQVTVKAKEPEAEKLPEKDPEADKEGKEPETDKEGKEPETDKEGEDPEEDKGGKEPETDKKEESSQDLKVWIKEGDTFPLSQEYITLVIENHSNTEQLVTYGYSIWKKQGEGWVPAPMNFPFPDVMEEIKPGETREQICILREDGLSEELQPGTYYVSKGDSVNAYFKIQEYTDPNGGLEMRVKGDSAFPIGQPSICFQIINHSTFTQSLSRYYSVYRMEGGEWVLVPLDYCFPDDMVDLEPGETWDLGCPLQNEAGDYFPPGQYRIEKSGLSIEFEIIE